MVPTTAACTSAVMPKARAYPSRRSSLPSGVVIRRSSVPLVRSRSVPTLVTMNITMKGNTPKRIGPNRSKTPGWFRTYLSRTMSRLGTPMSIPSVRRSCRSWARMRRVVASVIVRLMPRPPVRG
jgi:hypothetical protein